MLCMVLVIILASMSMPMVSPLVALVAVGLMYTIASIFMPGNGLLAFLAASVCIYSRSHFSAERSSLFLIRPDIPSSPVLLSFIQV